MAIIDVVNVGQGDCIIINPPQGCEFSDRCIMVDTGDGSCDITECIDKEKVLLFITHHDKDHFGGFKYFIGNKWDSLEKIILPFYQNELTLIAKAMLNLKGVSESVDCEQFIDYFEDIVNNQLYLKSISIENQSFPCEVKFGPKQIELCSEGNYFCNHIECLNPPRFIKDNNYDDKDIEKNLEEIFNKDFAKEIKMFLSAYRRGYYHSNSSVINNLFIYQNDKDELQKNELELNNRKAHLFFNFITTNLQTIIEFNNNPNRENYRAICNAYKQTSHDVCLVLKLYYSGDAFLLTGDASKKVFNRLIDEGRDISANYLKVPHHGSKHNLNKNILNIINPQTAIICHNNRRFGKSTDSHPNWEVLYMLKEQGAQLIVTNDVIKKGEVIIDKCCNSCSGNVVVKEIY